MSCEPANAKDHKVSMSVDIFQCHGLPQRRNSYTNMDRCSVTDKNANNSNAVNVIPAKPTATVTYQNNTIKARSCESSSKIITQMLGKLRKAYMLIVFSYARLNNYAIKLTRNRS